MIESINLENIKFYGDHALNSTIINGLLPRDKKKMIKAIDGAINIYDKKFLDGIAERNSL